MDAGPDGVARSKQVSSEMNMNSICFVKQCQFYFCCVVLVSLFSGC